MLSGVLFLGLEAEGLFRISGTQVLIDGLKKSYDKVILPFVLFHHKQKTPHLIELQ